MEELSPNMSTSISKDDESPSTSELRKKKIARKLQRLRLQQRAGISSAAVYEHKLRKLRSNNISLARSLAEQKIETQQWYNEVVTLKGELQDANERLLRLSNNKNVDIYIEKEVERRLKEVGEPLNTAISEAMDNLLVVVKNFSTVKKLNNVKYSSRSSSFSFPRNRAPLASSGSTPSPRQIIRPMVSGHVLQPATVSIQKLDDAWRARMEQRLQAQGDPDISNIREELESSIEERTAMTDNLQSNTSENVSSESEDDNNTEDTTANNLDLSQEVSTESSNSDSTPSTPQRRSSSAPSTPQRGRTSRNQTIVEAAEETNGNISSTETTSPRNTEVSSPKVRSAPTTPRRGRCSRKNQVVASPTETTMEDNILEVSMLPTGPKEMEESCITPMNETNDEHKEDPLEGPSWWYNTESSRKSRRCSTNSRGRKRNLQSSSNMKTPTKKPVNGVTLETSNEVNEDEEIKKKRIKTKSPSTQGKRKSNAVSNERDRVDANKSIHVDSPLPSHLEHSYLASPATMLTRLENLECKGGRRSKSKSKGRSLRVSSLFPDTASKQGLNVSAEENSLGLNEALLDECALMPPPPSILPPEPKPLNDILIDDNDLTCVADVSMEMTESLSTILAQAAAESKKNEAKERKFFKNQIEDNDNTPVLTKETPYDVSLMEETYNGLSTVPCNITLSEKENMPPESNNLAYDKDDLKIIDMNKSVNLRRFSIVLEDVLKSPNSENVKVDKSFEIESPKSKPGKKRKTTSTVRGKKSILVNYKYLSEDEDDDDDSWTPPKDKAKKNKRVSFKPKENLKKQKLSNDSNSPVKKTNGKSKRLSKMVQVKEEEVEDGGNNLICDFENDVMKQCYVKIEKADIAEVIQFPIVPNKEDFSGIDSDDSLPDLMAVAKKKGMKEKIEIPTITLESPEDENDPQHQTDRPIDFIDAQNGSDQVVPENNEPDIETNDIAESKVSLGGTMDSSPKRSLQTEEVEEADGRRSRRGAAMKIGSFKEPSLHSKMRDENRTKKKGVNNRRSTQRKSAVT